MPRLRPPNRQVLRIGVPRVLAIWMSETAPPNRTVTDNSVSRYDSYRDKGDPPTCRFAQSFDIGRIAGRDTVTTPRYEHDSCIDRIRHSSFTKKSTTGATHGFVNANYIDRVEESSEIDLATTGGHATLALRRGDGFATPHRVSPLLEVERPCAARCARSQRTHRRRAPGHSIFCVAETQLRLSSSELF